MAAVGAPVPLGLAVAAPAAAPVAAVAPIVPGAPVAAVAPIVPGAPVAAVAPIVPGAPTPFTDVIMTAIGLGIDASGYQLSYPVFIASLQPSLLHHYSPPGAARAAPAAAEAVAPGADPADPEIRRIDAYIRAHRPAGWTNNIIRTIITSARAAMPIPYDPANPAPYRAAFNGLLDAQANQLAAGVLAANLVGHVNIGP